MIMQISFDAFKNWAQTKFSNVIIKGDEIRLNSIFTDSVDKGHHLWCNPYGGKNNVNFGVYHCFKTDKKGTLIGLVMHVENCDFYTALRVLNGNLRVSNKNLNQILDFDENNYRFKIKKIEFPEFCFSIDGNSNNNIHKQAIKYLESRKINYKDFYVCLDGNYKNRIIIPYFNEKRELIYFNSRALFETKLRYLGPPKTIGVGKEDVLYFPKIPTSKRIYVTEGEFDAYILSSCGFSSAACGGKNLSDIQASMLSNFEIALCLDLDKAGTTALKSMKTKLDAFDSANSKERITVIRPAEGFKDWNEMALKHSFDIIKAYIEKYEKPFSFNLFGEFYEF